MPSEQEIQAFHEWCHEHEETPHSPAEDTQVEYDNGWVCRIQTPKATSVYDDEAEKFKLRDRIFRGSTARESDRLMEYRRFKFKSRNEDIDVDFDETELTVDGRDVDVLIESL